MAGPPKSYLTFRVARKDLAIEASQVRAILPVGDLIPVPRARHGVIGVVHATGRIVNVVDAKTRLQLPPWRRGKQRRIVVLGKAERCAAFIADRVCEVVNYAERNLKHGVLRGHGRSRTVVCLEEIARDSDYAEIWSLTP